VPAWLIEGMAEVLSSEALLARGALSRDARVDETWRVLTARSPHPLAFYERTAIGLVYAEAQRATVLASAGRPARLIAFCRAVGRGTRWRVAFRTTFGRSVEDVYRDNERLRRKAARLSGP
jgi:hypothetical protein